MASGRLRALTAASLALVVALAPQLGAQTRGNTVPVVHLPTFQALGQSMWGPLTAPADIDRTFTLVDVGWDKSGSIGDVADWGGFDFGARIRGATDGLFRLSSRLVIDQTGAVDIRYPVRVELRIPEPNSFANGEEIPITSSYALQPGWQFTTEAPAGSLTFSAGFHFGASAAADVCIFGCLTFNFFPPIDIGDTDFDLLRLSSDGGFEIPLIPAANFDLFPHTFSFIESEITGVSGTIDVPGMPNTTPSVMGDGRSLRAAGSRPFVDVSVDLDSYLNKAGFPIPLGFQTPSLGGASAGYNLIDVSMPIRFTTDQTLTFTPNLEIETQFPVAVAYRVTDAGGGAVASGVASQITFKVGHTLHITFPTGRLTPMPSAPDYTLDNTFTSATGLTFGAGLVETVGTLDIEIPSVTVIPEITVDLCEIATFGLEHCPITTPALEFPGLSLHLGPLFQASQALGSLTVPLFPFLPGDCTPGSVGCGRWTLQGFNSIAFDPFALDPEDPRIEVATAVMSGLATGTGPAGTLTQTIDVANTGDVRLFSTQAADGLTGGAFGVNTIGSPTLSENPAFNGGADPNTLTGADVLLVPAGGGTVTTNVEVEPGNLYTFAVLASGTSPIGTAVSDAASVSFAVYHFDIRPTPVNNGAQGVLPATVMGSAALNTRDIDPESIRLDGVAPIRWEYTDAGDLNLKFDRPAIMERLLARIAAGTLATTRIQVQVPDTVAVAAAVLGRRGALSEVDAQAADLLGNGNGRLDVGDLRAVLLAARGTPGGISLAGGGGGGGGNQSVTGTNVALPLTGNLRTGTLFMGEDVVVVLSNGRIQ
jgi:hypothetical protein